MKARPILFNGAMVNVILDGSKTQTRRVVKPQPVFVCKKTAEHLGQPVISKAPNWDLENFIKSPYGKVGDQLWVRETWNHDCYPYPISDNPIFHYRADYFDDPLGADLELSKDGIRRKWFPSIHMPRKASRIQLEITDIRVERLNEISECDAKAEGITPNDVRQMWLFGATIEDRAAIYKHAAVEPFRTLWESINGEGSWATNPWVWVIEFKVIKP